MTSERNFLTVASIVSGGNPAATARVDLSVSSPMSLGGTLRLLEVLLYLFHGRESFVVFLVHERHGRLRVLHQLILRVFRVCLDNVLRVFVCASIVSCVLFVLRAERGLQVDSHKFKVFLHGWICGPCFLWVWVDSRWLVVGFSFQVS